MIRKMHTEDFEAVLKIEKELFSSSPWPQDFFEYEMNGNPFSNLLVYEKDGKVVGYIDYWITYEQAQIANIAVDKEYWKKGIATELLTYAIKDAIAQECENVSLEVRVSNTNAISLYQRFGFIEIAKRKNYYENNEDALYMVKPIGGLSNDDDISN